MFKYFAAAAHPWSSLMFLAPLLAVYEGGVAYFANTAQPVARIGADQWLRQGLAQYGVAQPWAAPAAVVGLLLAACWWHRATRPRDPIQTLFGMVVESLVYAVALWVVAQNFGLLLSQFQVPAAAISFRTPATTQVISYVGAGIYEEALFRLGLFAVAVRVLRLALVPTPLALLVAGAGAALLFAYAHHWGPNGEPLDAARFLFRTVAGLYFTALYVARGFGIAVGAHVAYDVLVGVAVG